MITIQVEDTDGTQRVVETTVNPSANLMEILTAESFDIPAICGGMAGCGTCHITIIKGGEGLDKPDDDEEFMIDSLPNSTPTSRLSCQVDMTKELDGMEIKVLGDSG